MFNIFKFLDHIQYESLLHPEKRENARFGGAELHIYEYKTPNYAQIFADDGHYIVLNNPIIANYMGVFPEMYLKLNKCSYMLTDRNKVVVHKGEQNYV